MHNLVEISSYQGFRYILIIFEKYTFKLHFDTYTYKEG